MSLLDAYAKTVVDQGDIIKAQADEIERLREALGFYGNQHNWHPSVEFVENIPTHLGQSQIEIDGGDKARSALQQKETVDV